MSELDACRHCDKRHRDEGYASCEPCRSRMREASARYYADPEKRARHFAKKRQLRLDRIAEGVCSTCGKELVNRTLKLCAGCRETSRLNSVSYRAKQNEKTEE